MADPELELRAREGPRGGGGGVCRWDRRSWFCFAWPTDFSSFCDFFFLWQNLWRGQGGPPRTVTCRCATVRRLLFYDLFKGAISRYLATL